MMEVQIFTDRIDAALPHLDIRDLLGPSMMTEKNLVTSDEDSLMTFLMLSLMMSLVMSLVILLRLN